jgi:hypothetical protein
MQMAENKRAVLKEWLSSGKARLQPLTFSQRELWESSPVPVADVTNHICCLIHLRGLITPEACQAAIQRVVERQEVLRLSFLPGKERPIQMVRQTGQTNFRFRDLSASERSDEAVEEMAQQIFGEPFDLVQGPLYRAEMFRRAADEHVLVFAIHHAIADGWSLGVFVQDLCLAYLQRLLGLHDGLQPLPLTYSGWGADERAFWQSAELDRRGAFWKSNLSGRKRLWESVGEPETASDAPARWVSQVPANLAVAVRELARVTETTLFSTLLAAFQVAFFQWSGEEDILVGTPVANRTKQAVRETMGYCAGIVPLRGQVDPELSFSATLRAVHHATVESFSNAIPFAELAPLLGDVSKPGYNPVFEIRFALQNHPVPDVAIHGLRAGLKMRSTGTARFHLGCEITTLDEGMELVWLFKPKLFNLAEIKKLAYLFEAVLARTCSSPESRIATLIL